ncbi:hypothetical protein D915_008554 [Fasciola hepatica]|uniref:Uncharacterized protein n=1 Tax=Fasciola hepatica TaxID=6192 RepID=A0A4E0QZ76_FASHE|nr:hypothetical protein D915_008554 [Fasciola hepatica]
MCAFRLWFVVAVLVLIGFFGTDGATFLVKLEYDSLGHAFVKYKGKTYPCEKEQEVTLEDGNCRHNLYLKPPTQKERDERGGYVSGDVLCGYF